MFNFSQQFDAIKAGLVGAALLIGCTLLSLVWIGIGVERWLETLLGPVWGPIVLGGVFLVPVIVFALLRTFAPPRPKAPPIDPSVLQISRLVDTLSGTSPWVATIVAVLAGFLAVRFPNILRLFTEVAETVVTEMRRRSASREPGSE